MVGSGNVDYWRKFFRSASNDIFEVIENAIAVAIIDAPEDLRARRDGIVEKVFTAGMHRCDACVQNNGGDSLGPGPAGSGSRGSDITDAEEGERSVKREAEKQDKLDLFDEDSQRIVSNYSYDEAEALTEEIEEASQVYAEVLRIKDVLLNHQDVSDSVLFESLRRLQLMQLSVEVLKATEIGRVVNGLRKNNSKQIRHLVRTLIESWKVLVDEWVSTTAIIEEKTPDSGDVNVVIEEEGLPSPPLDEEALFANPTSIQLSEFFDGMDDDGNLRTNGGFDKKGSKSKLVENREQPRKLEQAFNSQNKADTMKYEEKGLMRKQQKLQLSPLGEVKMGNLVSKQDRLMMADSGVGRVQKLTIEQSGAIEVKAKQQQNVSPPEKKLSMVSLDKAKCSEEASVETKLELAKRKLHECYQQAENAKKQRTIQVMEIGDIPKKPQATKPSNMKFRNFKK